MKAGDGHLILPRPDAPLRLLCCHHAGGTATALLPLAERMPDCCEPLLFELPGRGLAPDLPPAADFAEAIGYLRPRMAAVIDRPVVVLGHSLGALLAHAVVAGLPPAQRGLVRAVVVSAFPSPAAVLAAAEPGRLRSRDELLAELRERDGSAAMLFEEPEVLEYFLQLLAADLHLADSYAEPPAEPLDADYHVWFGRDDRLLPTEQLPGWQAVSARPVELRDFAGGHFYLTRSEPPVRALCALLAGYAARA